jgi:hypothetical protein
MLLTAVGVVTAALIALAPRMKRDQLRKQLDGRAGGSIAAVGAGLDAVWRPTAEEAHAQWEAQLEMPAPAPTPGDPGGIEDGRLVINVEEPT